MEKSTLQRLNDLSEQLQALYEPFNVAHYTAPLNRDSEKQKLFASHVAGKTYNPQFTYHETPSEWDRSLRQFLNQLKPNRNAWEQWIYKDVVWTLDVMQAAETHDPTLTTTTTVNTYGEPSTELVEAAYSALNSLPKETEKRTIPARDMAERMREALAKAGLTNWCVIVSDTMSARMSVRSVEQQVKISAGHSFTVNELKRLLVHEIGTHVFRYANGALQPLKLLRFGFYNYLFAEEGLAAYHEFRYGVQASEDRRRYALRVIGAHLSLKSSLYDVFCELIQYTSWDEAFDIAMRAKRGFIDTSVPGCHVKDKVYFEGFHQVCAHLDSYPDDYALLMCGKVALDMLPMLRELCEQELLTQPKYLPELLIK